MFWIWNWIQLLGETLCFLILRYSVITLHSLQFCIYVTQVRSLYFTLQFSKVGTDLQRSKFGTYFTLLKLWYLPNTVNMLVSNAHCSNLAPTLRCSHCIRLTFFKGCYSPYTLQSLVPTSNYSRVVVYPKIRMEAIFNVSSLCLLRGLEL